MCDTAPGLMPQSCPPKILLTTNDLGNLTLPQLYWLRRAMADCLHLPKVAGDLENVAEATQAAIDVQMQQCTADTVDDLAALVLLTCNDDGPIWQQGVDLLRSQAHFLLARNGRAIRDYQAPKPQAKGN